MAEGEAMGTRVRRPIAVDLFSGAGGLSLGVEQAGFDIVASVEYVPGMMQGDHQSQVLEQLISEFRAAGFTMLEPVEILNASWFGVPQDRRRLFLIGARADQPLPHYPTSLVQPLPRRPAHENREI